MPIFMKDICLSFSFSVLSLSDSASQWHQLHEETEVFSPLLDSRRDYVVLVLLLFNSLVEFFRETI